MSLRFRINSPDVTYEVFDIEILIINLKNGNYYSLRESAVVIWPRLAQGWDVAEISAELAAHYGRPGGEVQAMVQAFVNELEANALIAGDATAKKSTDSKVPVFPATLAKPLLERYTDMQELLLLDPIHEVDVTGWPVKPQPPQS